MEKLVPKEKGIVAQTVKEVLQSLVDDHLVICEKIGTSNYFWSFPSTALNSRKTKLQSLRSEIEKANKVGMDLNDSIKKAGIGREATEERRALLSEWEKLYKALKVIDTELEGYKENDPSLHAERINQNNDRKSSINKWVDNINTVQSYCTGNFNIPKEQMKEAFGIPSDLDYV